MRTVSEVVSNKRFEGGLRVAALPLAPQAQLKCFPTVGAVEGVADGGRLASFLPRLPERQ